MVGTYRAHLHWRRRASSAFTHSNARCGTRRQSLRLRPRLGAAAALVPRGSPRRRCGNDVRVSLASRPRGARGRPELGAGRPGPIATPSADGTALRRQYRAPRRFPVARWRGADRNDASGVPGPRSECAQAGSPDDVRGADPRRRSVVLQSLGTRAWIGLRSGALAALDRPAGGRSLRTRRRRAAMRIAPDLGSESTTCLHRRTEPLSGGREPTGWDPSGAS